MPAIARRIGPAMGIVSVGLTLAGLGIHRYPDVRPSDIQLASWIDTTDLGQLTTGVYVDALGLALFLPFVAWLYAKLRAAQAAPSWLAITALVAGVGYVIMSLPINEFWVAILDQGKKGLDIRVAQTLVSANQAWFDMSSIVFGLFFLAAGISIIGWGAMARWAGWAAVLVGVLLAVPPIAYPPAAGNPLPALSLVWIVGVSGYYAVRATRAPKKAAAVSVDDQPQAGDLNLPTPAAPAEQARPYLPAERGGEPGSAPSAELVAEASDPAASAQGPA